ncbi:conserved protein of unknown function [Maridesulfovibrio hydrothermalis AM13 = DSM 14728]|uniref:Uncharacterized protein n=1 Tax=Maridesulfovibrio hydrothermalis AM13 = DSM 14728 TaxID=1121451 RepID=L0R779_9BACT|nr:conserved protein of unknown function [Maridesulfovibrio hydrothermalis AM13 = DSM 14728]
MLKGGLMAYKCLNCGWSGHWYELIHETMCPYCRCSAMRVRDNQDSMNQMMQPAFAPKTTDSPPQ